MSTEAPRGIDQSELTNPERWLDLIRNSSPFAEPVVETFLAQVDPTSVVVEEIFYTHVRKRIELMGRKSPSSIGESGDLSLTLDTVNVGLTVGRTERGELLAVLVDLYSGKANLHGPDLAGGSYPVDRQIANFLEVASEVISKTRILQHEMEKASDIREPGVGSGDDDSDSD